MCTSEITKTNEVNLHDFWYLLKTTQARFKSILMQQKNLITVLVEHWYNISRNKRKLCPKLRHSLN